MWDTDGMYADVLNLRRSSGAIILMTYRGDW